MKDEDKNKLAQKLFDGFGAKCWIEDELEEMFPGLLHSMGHDYYDSSLELYFKSSAPEDFTVPPEQKEEILSWGFAVCYCNFTDGTEQRLSKVDKGERIKLSYHRWTTEMEVAKECEF